MRNDLKKKILELSNGGFDFYNLILGGILVLETDSRCKNVKNPFYDDKNPSLSIYKDERGVWYYKDYGDIEFCGDVFSFCALYYTLDIKNNFRKLMEKMLTDLHRNELSIKSTNQMIRKPSSIINNEIIGVELTEIDFSDYSIKYWLQYGITINILKLNNVVEVNGYRQLLSNNDHELFMNFQNRRFYAYKQEGFAKLYCPNPKRFLYVGKKIKDYIFGLNFNNQSKLIFLVGGEKDVLTLHSLGFQAVCLNSETTLPTNRIMKNFYEDQITPIIMYDCDETGKKSAEKISNQTGWKIADLSSLVSVEDKLKIKDISDYILNKLCKDKLIDFLNSFSSENSTTEVFEDSAFSEELNNKIVNEIIIDKKIDDTENEDTDIENDDKVNSNYKSIPSKVYDDLPKLLKDIISPMKEDHKRDLVLTSSLSVLSNLINVSGTYGRMTVYPNLFLFITAPASAGKGVLRWVRKLGKSLQDIYTDNYKNDLDLYEENEKKGEKPKRKTVFVSGNSSVAAMLKQLHINDGRGIMLETEADSLNEAMKNQWGNLSDILRKCFEFEQLSSLRADDDKTFDIEIPRLSIVLTGTKNQLFNLIPSAQNGLFSRFLLMEFPLVKDWEDMFDSDNSLDTYYYDISRIIKRLFYKTSVPKINFKFTPSQSDRFNKFYQRKQNELDVLLGEDSIASVRRLGNMQFRIAMLISTLRMLEGDIVKIEIECKDVDYEIAETLALWFMNHTKKIFTQLPNKPVIYKELKTIDAKLFDKLPDEFTFAVGLEIAKSLSIPKGTFENMLRRFRKLKIIISLAHNLYGKAKE